MGGEGTIALFSIPDSFSPTCFLTTCSMMYPVDPAERPAIVGYQLAKLPVGISEILESIKINNEHVSMRMTFPDDDSTNIKIYQYP